MAKTFENVAGGNQKTACKKSILILTMHNASPCKHNTDWVNSMWWLSLARSSHGLAFLLWKTKCFWEIIPLHYQAPIADPLMISSPPYEITDNYGTTPILFRSRVWLLDCASFNQKLHWVCMELFECSRLTGLFTFAGCRNYFWCIHWAVCDC